METVFLWEEKDERERDQKKGEKNWDNDDYFRKKERWKQGFRKLGKRHTHTHKNTILKTKEDGHKKHLNNNNNTKRRTTEKREETNKQTKKYSKKRNKR